MKMHGRIYPIFGVSVLHEPLRIPLFVRLRQNNLLRSLRHACAMRQDAARCAYRLSAWSKRASRRRNTGAHE